MGLLFLRAGKNVLCEKPFAMNSRQVTDLVSASKKSNVFLMEVRFKVRCDAIVLFTHKSTLHHILPSSGYKNNLISKAYTPQTGVPNNDVKQDKQPDRHGIDMAKKKKNLIQIQLHLTMKPS